MIVHEIFASVQGESSRAGFTCGFVRLAGCNLNCRWCDTPRARDFRAGKETSLEEVVARVRASDLTRWEVTGGEPLATPDGPRLIAALCDLGLEVLVETNGSLDLGLADSRARRIVDVKGPSSGEAGSFLDANREQLTSSDELKFLVADRADFEFALDFLRTPLPDGVVVNLSPVWLPAGQGGPASIEPRTLVEWMLAERAALGDHARLNLQLHKFIWGPDAQGV